MTRLMAQSLVVMETGLSGKTLYTFFGLIAYENQDRRYFQ